MTDLTAGQPVTGTAGQRLFARYAYAPNHLGYCGPADSAALFELAATGRTTGDIPAIAARFTGAWPYLCTLAELAGIGDPLDERVVRAYWTGSALLDGVDMAAFGAMLLDRIGAYGPGRYWAHLTPGLLPEAAPTHCFHVLGVYPWSRLLGTSPGAPGEDPALHVLDSCRIRWGQVTAVSGGHATVRASRLTWDAGTRLLGLAVADETVRLTSDGQGFVAVPRPGQWLALHWDWACDRLTGDQVSELRRWTTRQVDATNARLARESGIPA